MPTGNWQLTTDTPPMTISTTIKTIQDIMRKDVGVDGDAQRIGQLVWMLFLKTFDDKESEWEMMEAR
jgi:type I restriction enzyme M protein